MLYNPYIEIGAFCFLLMTTFFFYRNRYFTDDKNIVFGNFLLVALINLSMDIASAYTISYAAHVPVWLNLFIAIVYLISQVSIPFIYLVYILVVTEVAYPAKLWLHILLSLPAIFSIVMILLSPFTSLIFYFDTELTYVHGSLFNLLYFSTLIYTLLGTGILFANRKRLPTLQQYVIIAYVLFTVAVTVIQYFFPYMLLSGFGAALSLMSLYMTFQNPREDIDRTTGFLGQTALSIVLDRNSRRLEKLNYSHLIVISFMNISHLFGMLDSNGRDKLLSGLSVRLRSITAQRDRLFRFGGHKFVLLCRDNEYQHYQRLITDTYCSSININGIELNADVKTFAIPIKLLSQANTDDYMYVIEEASNYFENKPDSNIAVTVDSSVIDDIRKRRLIEKYLDSENLFDYLSVHYQPILNVKTASFDCAEALLRINLPEIGRVPPELFIDCAERTGYIDRIGSFVLKSVYEFIDDAKLSELGIRFININLSALEFISAGLVRRIGEMRERYAHLSTDVDFEITESTAASSVTNIKENMLELTALGASFVLDDYGKGYSNKDILLSLPFKGVKLDKSLLRDVNDSSRRIMIEHTVKMFHSLGFDTVAEGVETSAEYDFATSLGVDYIQGYFYTPALSGEDYLKFIGNHPISTVSVHGKETIKQ